MQKTFETIAPQKIINEFVKVQEEKPAAQADAMWESLGEHTISVMADGCICLARLWDSAWQEGDGDLTINSLAPIEETVLEHLYQNRDFLPSHTIDTIGPLLAPSSPKVGRPAKARPPKRRGKKR